ncbi:MAG: class I SAM-dependent methyltransferase [Candidatus Woesearchaeota archaeon]
MPSPNEVYIKCDELDNIPKPNKENWLYEIELVKKELSLNAKVLQVGCMDGTRIMAILKGRPDLVITGLDMESGMIERSKKNLDKAGLKVQFIHADITKPLLDSGFDYVICLNNTLGYIPEEQKAIENMKKIGKKVILSVYGEKFTNELAQAYFKSINLQLVNIEKNIFHTKEFVNVKRYTREEVDNWKGKIIETPIGYFCIINKK